LEVMYDTDDEETQRGQRPWLPPSREAGRGRGLLAASQWSPDSTEVVGRTTLVDTVPMGCGRPRGDATTCPMDASMTPSPTMIEPGKAGRGGGGRVISGAQRGARAQMLLQLSLCRAARILKNSRWQWTLIYVRSTRVPGIKNERCQSISETRRKG